MVVIKEQNQKTRFMVQFTFAKTIIAFCIWGYKTTNLLFNFITDTHNMWNSCTTG